MTNRSLEYGGEIVATGSAEVRIRALIRRIADDIESAIRVGIEEATKKEREKNQAHQSQGGLLGAMEAAGQASATKGLLASPKRDEAPAARVCSACVEAERIAIIGLIQECLDAKSSRDLRTKWALEDYTLLLADRIKARRGT